MNIKLTNCLTRFLALLCTLSLTLAACSSSAAPVVPSSVPTLTAATGTYWPTEGWRTLSPEAEEMDSHKLAEMLDAIQGQYLALHSLLVIRNGYIVSETYFGHYQQDTRSEIYSCTKSVISTLIGIAIDKGYIDGVGHRIVDFFPDRTFANLDQTKQDITLEDVLTMRSGLDWLEADSTFAAMYRSQDWVKFMLDEPMARTPGSQFSYCSGCSHLLSAVLQQTTGMNTRDFAEQYLFKPLGITDAQWEADPTGIPIGGWGLQLTPRDMAKLGYLYLQDGQWDGQQIVSAKWVEKATQKHTDTDGDLGYGYQWWTYPSLNAYTALGRYGQTIFVIPESGLVIVTTAEMENHDQIFPLIEQYIVPAAKQSQ
ncbi:MAG TPA: serine hydrolase [Anaerolineales bacterium]|nr:serine hydrolase [Anaerolineales bacterium]